MQLHVHSQIAHVARTTTDGKWRAPDSLGYNEHIGAVAAIVSQHLEEALTRRFGLEWVARDDGHGFEIKGISGAMMCVFSSRRESITADLRGRAAQFEQRYGRKPSQRELAQLAQASNFATRAAKEGALDFAQLRAEWADKLARTLGVSLASVAPSVWHSQSRGAGPRTRGADGAVLTELELSRAAQKAVALAQQEKSAWTRADVIKYLGRVLPRSGMDPAAAAVLLEDLADRALASEFEPVACLEAPDLAEVPASLLRADGRSVYQRHGGTRYATRAQLAMEERMVAQVGASGAPRMTRAEAAHALGADPGRLEDALAGRAHDAGETQDAQDARAGGGLREDQAAAALAALTDGRLVSVINAPAGAGKTRLLAEAARIWAAAGLGPVIGITPSQSARNTLAAGVPESCNAAQFLGHLPGRRGARGPVRIGPGTLLVIDEASMLSGPELADLIAYAAARGAKIILAGDTSQLQAVENGGGMALLASNLGYARLAEPVRFRHAWEQHASLRLRGGDTSVLAEYDQQQSATQTRNQALAAADHLAILHAIWTAETTPARDQHYHDLLMNALPPSYRKEPGHQAKWLWRTVRAAELADLNPAGVLAEAIAERDLAGSRDIAAILDARLRHRLGALVPIPPGPWSARVPAIADPERQAYVAEIAKLMDARKDRIGEHAAGNPPTWAINALGEVPEHPLDRLDWQKRAAAIGAWRELSGYDHPADPIGPEPVAAAPDARAAWHEALAAFGPADSPDLRGMPDGRLLHLRDTYPVETAWAPRYVGDELRQVRARPGGYVADVVQPRGGFQEISVRAENLT
jgi:hypothetical protein